MTLSRCAFVAIWALQASIAGAQGSIPLGTNLLQLQQYAARPGAVVVRFELEGDVWWANQAQRRFVLSDASGAEALEMELPTFPQTGERVRLQGIGTVMRRGSAIQLGPKGPVVDNDGVHGMIEKSGDVYLASGLHPIRVEWFNGLEGSGLEVEYEGPEQPRRKITSAVLRRWESDAMGHSNLVNGLDFRGYGVAGDVLPDFSTLPVIKIAATTNFDPSPLPRRDHVGAVFSGFIEISQAGLYTFHLKSDDGSRLFVSEPTIRLESIGKASFPKPHRLVVGQVVTETDNRQWSEVEGKVTLVRRTTSGLQLELTAGAAHLLADLGDDSNLSTESLINARIRATGFCQSVHTTDGQSVAGVLFVPNAKHIRVLEATTAFTSASSQTNPGSLAVLSTASDVHRLKREEAQRAHPVHLHGVVTCVLPEHQAFTIHDSTRGIYIQDFSPRRTAAPEVGDYLEIEGTTDPGLFAPSVNASVVRSLGAGRLPEPIKPVWDQLNNGSLDAQQVELQGIVTEIHTNGVTLLTRGGVIKAELRPAGDVKDDLSQHQNALVRIRGCLLARWDYVTHQVRMGEVRIYTADILVDQPPPQDLFASPRKSAAELLQFDPQASVFQRVKVSGQIVYGRDAEYFLLDGERGLRFITKLPVTLATGDLVEVVGFPDLFGSASPVLREAAVRKIGHASLPAPRKLPTENLIGSDHDATRVQIEGTLVNVRLSESATVLELQNGVRTFIARLNDGMDQLQSLSPGSRLELTGVYAGLGGNRAAGQDIAAFELLLNTPNDIKVLARPSWWTLKRLLIMVGALICVLAGAALWINQLHRQVDERTAELATQIQQRQQLEHQRAMEEERTRIAQDLHDELGSGITEISMLAARVKSTTAPDEKRERHLDQVGSKARDLVTALDEIVWAMNPRHDSLASLVSYFSLYADRFLGLANIAWHLDGPLGTSDHAVDSRRRHQLFLAFKEALTNVVRHSRATEVRISICFDDGQLRMSVTDNGRGMPADLQGEDMNGVNNMRARIERLGGQFEIFGDHARGTTVRFKVPANYHS